MMILVSPFPTYDAEAKIHVFSGSSASEPLFAFHDESSLAIIKNK
jgi:hypothetical protein